MAGWRKLDWKQYPKAGQSRRWQIRRLRKCLPPRWHPSLKDDKDIRSWHFISDRSLCTTNTLHGDSGNTDYILSRAILWSSGRSWISRRLSAPLLVWRVGCNKSTALRSSMPAMPWYLWNRASLDLPYVFALHACVTWVISLPFYAMSLAVISARLILYPGRT